MLIAKFLQYLSTERRYSINTTEAYKNDLMQFVEYINKQYNLENINEANHLIIRSWLAFLVERGENISTVKRKLSTLKTFFKYLLKNKVITTNPMSKIITPKSSKRLTYFLDEDTAVNLFEDIDFGDDFIGKRDKLIFDLFYSTGIRVSELCNLKDADIDFYKSTIKVLGKRNKERIIPITERLCNVIKDYIVIRDLNMLSLSGMLFLNDKGKNINRHNVYLIINKNLSLVTTLKKRSPHVLRHTFATHMLNNGADINTVKEILGHTSLAATQVYTHNTIEKLKKVYKKAHPKA